MVVIDQIISRIDRYRKKATLIKKKHERDLYKTFYGDLFWLSKNPLSYVDKCIKETSVFEVESTNMVKKIIKQNDIVLDIGANIGYYSVIISKIVGEKGRVLCFEPTDYYHKTLIKNLQINALENVEVYRYGLSNKNQKLEIEIGNSSATLHNSIKENCKLTENINLFKLDTIIEDFKIDKIDFIKIDVDGHEHAFLEGAKDTIKKFNPIILLEVSHLNYLDYGITAWDFYDYLTDNGFRIYSEKKLMEYKTKTDFLIECGNFAYSANILISRNEIANLID